MTKYTWKLSLLTLVLGTQMVSAQTLYNNGSIVTDPGAGFNGSDVSQASAEINRAGYNVSVNGPNSFRLSDNFSVPLGGWQVTGITFQGLLSANVGAYGFPPTSPFTGINMIILDGSPAGSPNVIATSSTIGLNACTGVYRTFDGVLVNDQRPVFGVQATFPNVLLPQGNYWFDVQLTGSSPSGITAAVAPPLMLLSGATFNGNALQGSNGAWVTISEPLPGGSFQGIDLGFSVQGIVGVPEPGTWALLGLTAFAGAFGYYRWCRGQTNLVDELVPEAE